VGWEHSMKNELIIAQFKHGPNNPARIKSRDRLSELIETFGLSELRRWAI
jgi:hypothetical protein